MSAVKLAIPTVLAVVAIAFAFKTVGIGAAHGEHPAHSEAAAPTPYSADHSRIPAADAAAPEPAATF
jgi:hypothetical protein